MDDNNKKILAGVLMDDETTISFVEVCQKHHLSEEVLFDMIEHGLFSPLTESLNDRCIDYQAWCRIQSARRLQQDLGINLPGVVLVLELLDELERARNELRVLERHVKTP